MSSTTIKRHNHRVHPCETARKQDLLKELIGLYEGKSILVVSEANSSTTQIEEKNLTLSNDAELAKMDKTSWDVLISFDLPVESELYLKRLEYAKEMALILVDEKEQTSLYPIEQLLGKNIKQETIKGYEVKKATKKEFIKHRPTESQKRSAKDDEEKRKNQVDKERSFSAKKEWDKKSSATNHHHDKRTNPSKRAPRKIQISKDQQNKKD